VADIWLSKSWSDRPKLPSSAPQFLSTRSRLTGYYSRGLNNFLEHIDGLDRFGEHFEVMTLRATFLKQTVGKSNSSRDKKHFAGRANQPDPDCELQSGVFRHHHVGNKDVGSFCYRCSNCLKWMNKGLCHKSIRLKKSSQSGPNSLLVVYNKYSKGRPQLRIRINLRIGCTLLSRKNEICPASPEV
jgi:hypothetical protein